MTFPLSVFADKKMTIRNSDTGESFEVTVPDGLRIYEYNSNWLDSIPYLMEHTRYGEPWAFEALGDCYRYGKGGMTRSFINAIMAFLKADEQALLSKKAAGWLYHYCTQDPSSDWVGLNDEDLYRIGIIAGEVR